MSLSVEIDKAKEGLLECFELAQLYGDEDIKKGELYLEVASTLLSIKDQETRSNAALDAVKESCSSLTEFDSALQSELQKHNKRFLVKNTADYKSFAARIKRIQDADSATSDEMFMHVEINVFDPLSKKRMEKPVKNVICGHHYEQSTILEAIKINSRLRCPVVGCGNREFVKDNHLEIDNEFRKRLLQSAEETVESDQELG